MRVAAAGNGASADLRFERLEDRRLLSSAPPGSAMIIDDGEPDFAATGAWTSVAGANGWYGKDVTYARAGGGEAQAEWTFRAVEAGQYRIAASWASYQSGRAKDAPYQIWLDDQRIASLRVNQRPAPNDLSIEGTTWQFLGPVVEVQTGQVIRVRLSNDASGIVVADAARIERVASPGETDPLQLVDLVDPGTDGLIRFTADGGPLLVGQQHLRTLTIQNRGLEAIDLGRLEVPAGFAIASSLPTGPLAPGATATFTLAVAAQAVGTVEGLAVLHSATNQPLLAIPLHATLVNYQIRDNESADFSRSGTWSEIDPYPGWYRDSVACAVPGEPAVAEWRFD